MNKIKFKKNINPLFFEGIAHRGLHNDEFTENGLKAFNFALVNNLAIELDVHLTLDDALIVCHDESLKRTTGKEGIIEDLTLKEIEENYTLLDGGKVPTLKDVLELVNEKVPLVVELKVYRKNYKALAKRVLKELKIIKDPKNICLISFDPRALFYSRKSPFNNSLLICESHKWVFRLRYLFDSIDIEKIKIKENKVKKYNKKHILNVWTIESKEELDDSLAYCDTVTFQNLDYKYVKEKLKEKNFN